MLAKVSRSGLRGTARIPGSKSHMIRSLYFAALSKGESIIRNPVRSSDSLSAAGLIRAVGVDLDMSRDDYWIVRGGEIRLPENIIDIGNSGTSMNIGSAILASLDGMSVVTGDEQIRKRPAQPVLNALIQLGAEARTVLGNGSAPFIIKGPLKGGKTMVEGIISQYVSSAIVAGSLAEKDTEVVVDQVNEIPYIEMTLHWMNALGVEVDWKEDFSRYFVKAGQKYRAFDLSVPSDFSSGAFLLIGGAITDSDITLQGLDTGDVQGDKILIDILQDMGAGIEVKNRGSDGILIQGGRSLKGRPIDCSCTPDSIPILSVLGCYAAGETKLYNIESSRMKETDRPLMMVRELKKMGADIELTEKELIIHNSRLKGAELESYGDHRIAMALCIAGLIADGETVINRIESATVSFPGFDVIMQSLGAAIEFC